MAKRTITTYEYTCDLCGTVCQPVELATLYGERGTGNTSPGQPLPPVQQSAGVCTRCQDKPISALLEFLDPAEAKRELGDAAGLPGEDSVTFIASRSDSFDPENLITRAFGAWFRSRSRMGEYSPDQPANTSYLCELDGGRRYVVLQNCKGVMAVYRVRPSGVLREMKRWPKAVA
ncbi:MAG TPA: hypothetical protein VF070_31610 [Streptosporangiaceae bacterium]